MSSIATTSGSPTPPLEVVNKRVPALRVVSRREVLANYKTQGPLLWARLCADAKGADLVLDDHVPCQALFHEELAQPTTSVATGAPTSPTPAVDTEVAIPLAPDAASPKAVDADITSAGTTSTVVSNDGDGHEDAVAQRDASVRVYDLPALDNVVSVTYKGPYDGLQGVYRELFAWIDRERKEVIGPTRELYHGTCDHASGPTSDAAASLYVTEVQVPVRELGR